MTSDGSDWRWDALVKNFNAHKYTVTDRTDKEFVGINITHDANSFNYYMDQTRMITDSIKGAKLTGAKDERLPYPIGNDPISDDIIFHVLLSYLFC